MKIKSIEFYDEMGCTKSITDKLIDNITHNFKPFEYKLNVAKKSSNFNSKIIALSIILSGIMSTVTMVFSFRVVLPSLLFDYYFDMDHDIFMLIIGILALWVPYCWLIDSLCHQFYDSIGKVKYMKQMQQFLLDEIHRLPLNDFIDRYCATFDFDNQDETAYNTTRGIVHAYKSQRRVKWLVDNDEALKITVDKRMRTVTVSYIGNDGTIHDLEFPYHILRKDVNVNKKILRFEEAGIVVVVPYKK